MENKGCLSFKREMSNPFIFNKRIVARNIRQHLLCLTVGKNHLPKLPDFFRRDLFPEMNGLYFSVKQTYKHEPLLNNATVKIAKKI